MGLNYGEHGLQRCNLHFILVLSPKYAGLYMQMRFSIFHRDKLYENESETLNVSVSVSVSLCERLGLGRLETYFLNVLVSSRSRLVCLHPCTFTSTFVWSMLQHKSVELFIFSGVGDGRRGDRFPPIIGVN